MILDLLRFVESERPFWDELDRVLKRIADDPYCKLSLPETTRLQYLYQRAASGLGKLSTFSAEPQTRAYLESLVARAYSECHPNRGAGFRIRPLHWLFSVFPQTFRRHVQAFYLTVLLTIAGAALGGCALWFDPGAKPALMPFSNLNETPAQRVKHEEQSKGAALAGVKGTFSAELMTHNIQVSLLTFAFGATLGIGSIILLFYNGVTMGAVAVDYIHAGFTPFLLGWLLPHGVIEIPAILISGQAAFVLASALIGWGDSSPRSTRLRFVADDVVTLAGGAALMLVWAGVVEAFVSQYHYPVLPYGAKITFGLVELAGLTFFLARSGRHASH